jgi:hypothetical protein
MMRFCVHFYEAVGEFLSAIADMADNSFENRPRG